MKRKRMFILLDAFVCVGDVVLLLRRNIEGLTCMYFAPFSTTRSISITPRRFSDLDVIPFDERLM